MAVGGGLDGDDDLTAWSSSEEAGEEGHRPPLPLSAPSVSPTGPRPRPSTMPRPNSQNVWSVFPDQGARFRRDLQAAVQKGIQIQVRKQQVAGGGKQAGKQRRPLHPQQAAAEANAHEEPREGYESWKRSLRGGVDSSPSKASQGRTRSSSPSARAVSIPCFVYACNNNNKRPLTPKSMPPAGDEHAKLKT